MFSRTVIEKNLSRLLEAFRPAFEIHAHTPAEVDAMVGQLHGAVDEKGNRTRVLTAEEERFIVTEKLLSKVDFAYWAERHCKISRGGAGLGSMYPLLESQRFILKKLGVVEDEIEAGTRQDGILVNLLKGARQIGGSTFAEAVGAHRHTTQTSMFGLIAADEPTTSAFMFDMFERIVENLPWWLCPRVEEHVKNSEMLFETESHVWVGAGKSTRGTEGQRGQLGRGKSLSFVHLSELSTWEATSQIDGALMWTVARHPRVFVFFESTAKGRHNWWHEHWDVSKSGKGRFTCIFIPWYAEPKYSQQPPTVWTPKDSTLSHAKLIEETSPRYMGRAYVPTRAQLYWYELARDYAEAKEDMKTFIEEIGAVTDDDAFQHSGTSIFKASTLQRIREQSRMPIGLCEIKPLREVHD